MIALMLATGLTIAPQAVIDGDTFKLPSGEIIRISNIDTPESGARAKCDAELFLAVHARAELARLLGQGGVQITRLPPAQQRDPYQRTLARVSISGIDVGGLMQDRALAVEWQGKRHAWCEPRRRP
jgi:micrococcal nuclease